MIGKSAGRRTFEVLNVIILLIVSFLMLYPFYYCIIASLSDNASVLAGKLSFWPIGLNFKSYKLVLGYKVVLTSYGNTLIYTTLGTTISLVLTVLGAYPLSRKDFYGKSFFTVFFAFTMFFGGGLIPTFLVVRSLGFYNTMWAIVLPSAINTMNMIIMRTFFQGMSGPSTIDWSLIGDAKELTIIGSQLSPHCYEPVIECFGNGSLSAEGIVTHVFDLENWEAAFAMAQDRNALKVLIKP